MNKIYVTGLHRAGTHALTEVKAKEHGVLYLEEKSMMWDDYDGAYSLAKGKRPVYKLIDGKRYRKLIREKELDNGFALQCPYMAQKTLELAKRGKVYWATRNLKDVATSMKNGGFWDMSWDIIRGFHSEFPDDPIWKKLVYKGSEDRFYGFVQHHMITIMAKEYFFKKYFLGAAERIVLEEQEYYDETKTSPHSHPLSEKSNELVERVMNDNASICGN